MRIAGFNAGAIATAALAIYAVGFVTYGLLFDAQWMSWSGHAEADFKGQEWRMALSPLMPILIAVGLAWLLRSLKITHWTRAIGVGLAAGLFFAVSDRLYSFVYGVEPVQLLALDTGHQLVCFLVGSAVLSLMKPA